MPTEIPTSYIIRKTFVQYIVIFIFSAWPYKTIDFFSFGSKFDVLLLRSCTFYKYNTIPGVTSIMRIRCRQVIMISLSIFIVCISLIPLAIAGDLPLYDTVAYCREIGDLAGGSSQVELVCRQDEEAAKDKIDALNPSARIMKYCDEVARVAGGSYQILEVCIEDELSAEEQLHR